MRIYIPTRGRIDNQVTYESLPPKLREKAIFVVDEMEASSHRERYTDEKVMAAPFECNSIGKVRQFIIDQHNIEAFGPKLIMLDDDLGFNMRRTDIRTKFLHATDEAIIEGFKLVEELLETHAHGGIRHRQMSQDAPDIDYNCRTLRALAYNVKMLRETDVRFDRLIVMEDFDLTLQLLRKGYPNFNISSIIQGQGASNAPGGCSLYRDWKRQEEGANGLADLHPGFVKVKVKKTNWKGWGSDERVDVSIAWKKAYESSGAAKVASSIPIMKHKLADVIGIDKFFAVARERYSILLKRRAGMPAPWSDDPIFQTEYFCNVFREDDKTTTWFRENIRDKLRDDPKEVLAAITAFRWFNKVETGELLKPFLLGEWDQTKIFNKLHGISPIVTGAYIIKTPDGMQKLKGVLWCIEEFIKNMEKGIFDRLTNCECSMEEACELLQKSPYLGNFMAWQICSDARQTCLLETAEDCDTWAQPGPGSARGLGRIYYNDPEHFNYGSKKDDIEMLKLMNELACLSHMEKYWPKEWPTMDVSTIQHLSCEVDKYCRCEEGGRMKRKYNATI